MFKGQNGVSGLMVVSLIVLLIFGGFIFFQRKQNIQKSPDTTSDSNINQSNSPDKLKNYKNDSLGVSFSYSEGSEITFEVKNGHTFINGEDRGPSDGKDFGVRVKIDDDSLWVTKDDGKYADDVGYFGLELVDDCNNYLGENQQEKIINGLSFKYEEKKGAYGGKGLRRTACLAQDGKNWLLINETYNEENFEKTDKLYKQILSSFKLSNS